MAYTLDIRGDSRAITRHLRGVQRKVIPQVTVSSLTGTAREVRKTVLKEERARLGVPARELNKRARIRRASRQRWTAAIIVNRAGINPVTAYRNAKQTAKGVRAGSHFYRSHWIMRGKNSGTPLAFYRIGKARIPIKARKIPMDPVLHSFASEIRLRGGTIFRRLMRERLRTALNRRGFASARLG